MGLSKGFEVLSNHLTDRYTELKLCPALQKTLNCFINHKVIVYDTLLSERARLLNFESTQREDIYEKNHDIEKKFKTTNKLFKSFSIHTNFENNSTLLYRRRQKTTISITEPVTCIVFSL